MGRPPFLDKKLIIKIAKKLNKPELNIRKSISAAANRLKISSEAALILLAEKHNIGFSTAQRKLSPEKQIQIRSVTTERNNIKSNVIKRQRGKLNVKNIIKAGTNDYQDPFLNDKTYSNIAILTEAYSILYILENSLRLFVERVLTSKHGVNWWDKIKTKKATSDIAKEVERRKNKETENWHHAKRGAHEIYYTDYQHLLQFIKSFDSEFSSFFKKVPERNLPGKLTELIPTRNIVAHNNPITKNDLIRLQVHTKDWLKYMQYLYSKSKK